jgi:lactoylglutathione lyase
MSVGRLIGESLFHGLGSLPRQPFRYHPALCRSRPAQNWFDPVMPFSTESHPGVDARPNRASNGFTLNHCMLRVKGPAVSLDFYTRVFGMAVLRKLDFPEMKFSLYFLHRAKPGEAVPEDAGERTAWTFAQRGVLELTHNWGTEAQVDFKYHDGNAQPQGFGHICFSVPDLDAAIAWLDENKLTYVKRPDQGKMRDVAFVKDPDGYWIEIVEPARLKNLGR